MCGWVCRNLKDVNKVALICPHPIVVALPDNGHDYGLELSDELCHVVMGYVKSCIGQNFEQLECPAHR